MPQQRSTPPQATNQQPPQQQQPQSHAPEQNFVNVVHQQHHPINTPSPVPVQPSVSPPQQQQPSAVPSAPVGESADKANVVKKFVLNPAAKPFTPRMPVTPNSSRPHTPQTPSTQINQAGTVYTPPQPTIQQQASLPPQGQPPPSAVPASIHQHVQQHQPQMMAMTYVMQPPQSAFQTPQHPHATQQTRFRKGERTMCTR